VFRTQKKLIELTEELLKAHRGLAALKSELADQKSAFRNLELEWVNCHEKFKAIMGRLHKRDADLDRDPPEPPSGPNSDKAPGPFDHLDPVSKGIHERRSRR